MSDDVQSTCSCCQLEKSNLREYPELGMMLCVYCELLPASVLQQAQQNPEQSSIFMVIARLIGKLELRVLRQDPDIPLRMPIHDKSLALVLQLAQTKMCKACNNINTCTCSTGQKSANAWAEPAFWPYAEARAILKQVEEVIGKKPT